MPERSTGEETTTEVETEVKNGDMETKRTKKTGFTRRGEVRGFRHRQKETVTERSSVSGFYVIDELCKNTLLTHLLATLGRRGRSEADSREEEPLWNVSGTSNLQE